MLCLRSMSRQTESGPRSITAHRHDALLQRNLDIRNVDFDTSKAFMIARCAAPVELHVMHEFESELIHAHLIPRQHKHTAELTRS